MATTTGDNIQPKPHERNAYSYYDVIIIGAGITGINAAYRIETACPNYTYAILDRRHEIGGTWSFFKYPGIRSDSDLNTMGFAWNPWEKPNPIADGASIADYVRQTATSYGIDGKIKYGHDVVSLDWNTRRQRWSVGVNVDPGHGVKGVEGTVTPHIIETRFVIAGTGFFDYRQPQPAVIPGIDTFGGTVVHPQFWSKDIDYTDKQVVVIGSGATAITIVPAVAKKAKKTIMLQRSPTYIMSLPMQSTLHDGLRRWLPKSVTHAIIRWHMTILAWMWFYFSQFFPETAKKVLKQTTLKELPKDVSYEPDFKPRYNVWDQRLCVCPDGDFFRSLEGGKAQVVTDTIKTVEKDGIVLDSGKKIPADIVVTATGLKLQMLGGAKITLDGKRSIEVGEQYMWRGTMLQDVPNLMLVIGYWNNSWTVGADLATRIFIKCIKNMEFRQATSFVPTLSSAEEKALRQRSLWNMTSTYLQNNIYPKASDTAPWSVKDNYLRDWLAMKVGNLNKGLRFDRMIDPKK